MLDLLFKQADFIVGEVEETKNQLIQSGFGNREPVGKPVRLVAVLGEITFPFIRVGRGKPRDG